MKKILFPVLLFLISLGAIAQCPTDITGDGQTTQTDLNQLFLMFGKTCGSGPCPTDINGDGVTSQKDLNLLFIQFGKYCSAPALPPDTPDPVNVVNPINAFDITPPALNTALAVGSTDGSFAVTPTGAASNSISLQVPPGTRGIAPNLSVSYNSNAGDGIMGVGWSLSGLSSITRAGQSVYYNGKTAPVTLTNNDNYILDGSYLIPTAGGINGAPGTVYATENEKFVRVKSYGYAGNYDPSYFRVATKDGSTLEYGNTSDSYIFASGDSHIPLKWLLNKVTDNRGNYMTISYKQNNTTGEYYPDRIDYTGSNSFAPYNRVKFVYQTRTDKQTAYVAGHQVQQNVLLSSVQMESPIGTKVHEYQFNYSADELNSHLSEVKEIGSDGTTMYNSTKIAWHPNLKVPVSATTLSNMADNPDLGGCNDGSCPSGIYQRSLLNGDFNGDGFTDAVEIQNIVQPAQWLGITAKLFLKTPGTDAFTNPSTINYPSGYQQFYENTGPPVTTYPNVYPSTVINPVDINGDGKDDLILFSMGSDGLQHFNVFISSGTNFTSLYTFTGEHEWDSDFNFFKTAIGDFDGDGIADLVIYYPLIPKMYLCSVKNGAATQVEIPNFLSFHDNDRGVLTNNVTNGIFSIDINGDGRKELLITSAGHVYVSNLNANGTATVLSVSDYNGLFGPFSEDSNNEYECKLASVFPGDFNGDGNTDVLVYNNVPGFSAMNGQWSIGYSNGKDGFNMSVLNNLLSNSMHLPFVYETKIDPGDHEIFVADLNGDGKDDIVDKTYVLTSGTKTINQRPSYAVASQVNMDVYFSRGGNSASFVKKSYSLPTSSSVGAVNPTSLGDFNADGHADLLYYGQGEEPNRLFTFDLNDQPDNGINKVIALTNGLNATTKIIYDNLPDLALQGWYVKGNTAVFPLRDIQIPIYVAQSVWKDNGLGAYDVTNYEYNGAQVHLQGKGFRGFTKLSYTNLFANIRKEDTYSEPRNIFFERTLLSSQTSLLASPYTPINLKLFTFYATITSVGLPIPDNAGKRYYEYPSSYTEYDQLHGNTTSYTITQDKWGNVTDQVSSNSVVTSSIHNTFEIASWIWIPSCLKSYTTTVTRAGQPEYKRFANFTNNVYGQPLTKTEDAGATTAYIYDDAITDNNTTLPKFGNLRRTEATGGVLTAPRTNEVRYDPQGRFVIKQINALDQSALTPDHDAYGNVLTETDANGLTTTHTYDAFGRLTSTTIPTKIPGGKTISTTRLWDSSVDGSLFKVTTSLAGTSTSVEYFDKLGRSVMEQNSGFDDNTSINVKKTYKISGLLESVSEPFFSGSSSSASTSYEYNDIVHRVSKVTLPSGAYTDYLYSGNTTTVTAHEGTVIKTTTQVFDASGALTSLSDNGGTIGYTYHSCGKPLTITTPDQKVISMSYDAFGRQASLNDPDAGLIRYDYNVFGEVFHEQDAKQLAASPTYSYIILYDGLGRIFKKNSPQEGNITYTYDDPDYGIGMIDKITGLGTFSGMSYNYDYNVQGLLSSVTKNMGTAVGTYTTSYTYDDWNRLSTETYPGPDPNNRFSVKYNYNGNGYLQSINNLSNNNPIWTCDHMTERLQVKNTTYGNNLTLTKGYSSLGYLQSTQVKDGSTLKWDQAYGFDPTTGNLTSRADNTNSQSETFQYDNLDRLTKIFLNGSSSPISSFSYPGIGSISTKTDAGSGYEYTGLQPHGVSAIANPNPDISHTDQNIAYTPFNKPDNITESPNTLQFSYGPDLERTKTVLTNQGNLVKTIIYCDDYEKITKGSDTYDVYYINSPDGLVAMNVRHNGITDGINYVYTDHLGSINLIYDQNKAKVYEQNFDAWGRNRKPNDWTAYNNVPVAPDWLIRGYTRHEHLREFGLVNMNARMYDPIAGRMLSPDNEVQSPDFTQCYNRYSYCFNNPLKFIDPSGNDPWDWITSAWNSVVSFFSGNWTTSTTSTTGNDESGNEIPDPTGPSVLSEFTFTDHRISNASSGSSAGGIDFFTPVWLNIPAINEPPNAQTSQTPGTMPMPVLNHVNNTNTGDDGDNIIYQRMTETNQSTTGNFSIPGTDIHGYILEPAGPSTTQSGLDRRIPAGTYNLIPNVGTKYGLRLFNDQVSQSRAILIHRGSLPEDTQGCLLPGSTIRPDFVGGSRNMVNQIMDYFNQVGYNGATITILDIDKK